MAVAQPVHETINTAYIIQMVLVAEQVVHSPELAAWSE